MIAVVEEGLILFMGRPVLNNIHDMQVSKMFLSDIPIYDVTREVILLKQQILAESEIRYSLPILLSNSMYM